MKKFFPIVMLFPFLLVGCTLRTNDNENDDLLMKEKCSSYVSSAKERIEKKTTSAFFYSHVGTYYSKDRKSCITKYKEQPWLVNDSTNYNEELRTNYYDELTGEEIVSYPQNFEEARIEFEKNLQLLE